MELVRELSGTASPCAVTSGFAVDAAFRASDESDGDVVGDEAFEAAVADAAVASTSASISSNAAVMSASSKTHTVSADGAFPSTTM